MMTHPLLPKLKELRLSGMVQTLEARSEYARSQKLAPVEFLAMLLDDEIERRRRTRLTRREAEAGFEAPRSLAQFDFGAAPGADRAQILELSTCTFVERHENWLLYGPTGTGKTHLATAVGSEAIARGYRVIAASTHRLIADLLAARADATYQRRMQRLCSCDLLILDDFGLRPIPPTGGEDLYEIIHRRYERGSIILTSNRAPSEWDEVFGDGLLASAALDRLTHHAHMTCITGESYRQRHRRKEEAARTDTTQRT